MSGTNRNRPWDKWDPSPGQTGTPSQGQTGRFLFNSTVKSPFCPVCPWDGCSYEFFFSVLVLATKMTGRPGHWSEPGEYNICFLGSVVVISSQDSSALGYREFTQEGAMTISPFAARKGTSAPQWPIVKKTLSSPCSVQ